MSEQINVSNEWIAYAENDLEAVLILAEHTKPQIEIICYHCQQMAEKYLKSFIAYNDGRILKTHDLVTLCEVCSEYDMSFKEIIEICSDLSVYATDIRYPNRLDIDLENMNQAIKMAKEIRSFVKVKLE